MSRRMEFLNNPTMRNWIAILALALALFLYSITRADPAHQPGGAGLHWVDWSNTAFEQADRDHKLVILHLGAVWCHWCHVMEEVTYHDPEVIELLKDHFVQVYVDQDARPDISNKYQDYGWPATIIFDGKGRELVKMAGYVPPKRMISLLKAVVADPTPGPSVLAEEPVQFGNDTSLDTALRDEMLGRYFEFYDSKQGAWGTNQKYLHADSIELAMRLAAGKPRSIGNIKIDPARCRTMAEQTLKGNLALIDPVWGGVYQYSTDDDWEHPHFEKIMSFQADDMRLYATAYLQWHNDSDLKAARDIERFLLDFLRSPDGTFYVSQDADIIKGEHAGEYFKLDDAGRRKQGVPAIDKHFYARENGWAIRGLASLYVATGRAETLAAATRAADAVLAQRKLPGGGFRHDEKDAAGPYLGDTLAMGNAFLSLYEVTADRAWLTRSQDAAKFIAAHFTPTDKSSAGFVTSAPTSGPITPAIDLDENITLARWTNRLYHYTGNAEIRKITEQAMRYLATPSVARGRRINSGTLLADMEFSHDPLHLTVVGAKDDPKAKALFMAALRYPASYKRVEWWDKREGPLPRADVEYPELPNAAAFVCGSNSCSPPMTEVAELLKAAARRE